MKSKKSSRATPPQSGGETFQIIEVNLTEDDYCIPLPKTRKVVKPVPMGEWLGRVVLTKKKKAKPE